jgi:hypothetical protein
LILKKRQKCSKRHIFDKATEDNTASRISRHKIEILEDPMAGGIGAVKTDQRFDLDERPSAAAI